MWRMLDRRKVSRSGVYCIAVASGSNRRRSGWAIDFWNAPLDVGPTDRIVCRLWIKAGSNSYASLIACAGSNPSSISNQRPRSSQPRMVVTFRRIPKLRSVWYLSADFIPPWSSVLSAVWTAECQKAKVLTRKGGAQQTVEGGIHPFLKKNK